MAKSRKFDKAASVAALLAPWSGPYGGVPPFDKVAVDAFKDAMLQAMDLKRKELAAITANTEPATFENTIVALEATGDILGRVGSIMGTFTSTRSTKKLQAIAKRLLPARSAFGSEFIQNQALAKRIKAVYDGMESANLTVEQKLLVDDYYQYFNRSGANVSEADKPVLAKITSDLNVASNSFGDNQLHDEEQTYLVIDNKADLVGLSDDFIKAAAALAEKLKHPGKWVVANTRSAMDPFLSSAKNRDLREKAFALMNNRGNNNDAWDNKENIKTIRRLRAERAKLLGYKSHAHWVLDDNMAKTPEAALKMMMRVWKAAVKQVKIEVAEMQAFAAAEGAKFKIAPHDYRYYLEKVKAAKYAVDKDEVRQYLQLDKILEGMFWSAKQVHKIDMVRVTNIPVVHRDITTYEVHKNGEVIALFYFDLYARKGKRSGAWNVPYRAQSKYKGRVIPIVSNNSNFVKGVDGAPTLISLDDFRTLFHEFGHGLHTFLSNVNYPSLAGTAVKHDFVEYPSQLNERWMMTTEMLKNYALHHKTGAPMSDDLIAKIKTAENFGQGFATAEYLACAIYDMKVHLTTTDDTDFDPIEFEKKVMKEIGCPEEIVMRHRPTHFSHSFSGGAGGYSAAYYVYIWADAYVAHADRMFQKVGYFDRALCDRLSTEIYSVGGSVPTLEAAEGFLGGEVDPNALLEDRGFPIDD